MRIIAESNIRLFQFSKSLDENPIVSIDQDIGYLGPSSSLHGQAEDLVMNLNGKPVAVRPAEAQLPPHHHIFEDAANFTLTRSVSGWRLWSDRVSISLRCIRKRNPEGSCRDHPPAVALRGRSCPPSSIVHPESNDGFLIQAPPL
jgi:hypothetical protein